MQSDLIKKKIEALQTRLHKEEKQEYLVQVHIIEARNIAAVDTTGTSDPFIKITVGNQTPQVTQKKDGASTVVFDQNFTFDGLKLNNVEFENFEILIEAYDYNDFLTNTIIGSYSIGLSTLYRSSKHEYYNKWIPLQHQQKKDAQGYLLISCYIVKSGDRPPVHEAGDIYVDPEKDPFKDIPEEELTVEQQMERKKLKSKLQNIEKPITTLKQCQLLINIVKIEDLQVMSSNSVDSFISIRAGGNVLRTVVQENSQKPSFLTRFKFPIKWPTYNANIVIYVWDRRRLRKDTFIAQVPEKPSDTQFFNINFLQSQGGIMPYRWFNLYGLPMDERPSGWGESKTYSEGTQYMGRILISMSLSRSDKPDLGLQALGAYREPKVRKCVLRCHTYEIQGSHDFGDCIKVIIKIGGKQFESNHCKQKVPKKQDQNQNKKNQKKQNQNQQQAVVKKGPKTISYEWKYQAIGKYDIPIDLPYNPEETPDIIISVYEYDQKNKKIQDERKAFYRINYNNPDLENNQPHWYQLKPVKPGKQLNAFILCNIQVMSDIQAQQEQENIIKRSVKIPYIFRAYVYAGYDLSQDTKEIQSELEIILNGASYKLNNDIIKGRNPIWNEIIEQKVELDEKLEFASNLILNCTNAYNQNQKQNIWEEFFGSIFPEDTTIGECIIPLSQMDTQITLGEKNDQMKQFKPNFQFYHIRQKGLSKGRILAAFHLFLCDPNQMDDYESLDGKFIKDPTKFVTTNLEMPIIGVRGIQELYKIPAITLKIAQEQTINPTGYWTKEILLNEEDQTEIKNKNPKGIKDPTFCQIIDTFQKEKENSDDEADEDVEENPRESQKQQYIPLKLPLDMRFTPQIEIEFYDKSGGQQKHFSYSLNMIQYIPWCYNQNTQLGITEWFEEGKFSYLMDDLEIILNEQEEENNVNDRSLQDDENIITEADNYNNENQNLILDNISEQNQQFNNQNQNNSENDDENEIQAIKKMKNHPQQNILNNEDIQINVPDEASKFQNPNSQQFKQYQKLKNGDNISKAQSYMSSTNKQDQLDVKIKIPHFKSNNEHFEETISFSKSKEDQIQENMQNQNKIDLIMQYLDKLRNLTNIQKKQLDVEQIRMKFVKVINELKSQDIKESDFLDGNETQDGKEGVDYGNREILKENFEEVNQKNLPYLKYPLFLTSNLNKYGVLSFKQQGILKAHLRLSVSSEQKLNQSIFSGLSNYKQDPNQSLVSQGGLTYISNGVKKRKSKNRIGLINYKSSLDHKDYPFDIFDTKFLEIFKQGFNLKCRVYINRCLNLSAQESQIEGKQLMAGNEAKCTASCFPQIQIGDGDRSKQEVIKYINDDKNIISGTLSPQFYKLYELDAFVPQDWCLKVKIMNSGIFNTEIGGFEIDLEDRIFSYKEIRQRIVFQLLEELYSEDLAQIKFKYDKESKEIKNDLQNKISQLNVVREQLNPDIKLPIEFQELKHPNKSTVQGTAEILLEPFTEEIAQEIPFSYFEAPKPLEFELRLIIWETKDIPRLDDKEVVSIMVTAALDKSATGTGEEITKETDVHNGSTDGNGQFNYRMKFPIVIPTKFPRLRVQVYDFHAFEGNDLVGETVINLNKIIRKLRSEGKYELEPSDFEFQHPSFPGQDRGSVNMSIQVISKQEANSNEVGEGQDEPNQNPFLKKPTEGRGMGDFIKGGLSFNIYGMLFKQILKYLAGLAISTITTMILFVNPGILVK